MYITRTPHVFHSSAGGHLGLFHILAIVNTAAMNIGVMCIFKLVSFFFFKYSKQGVELLYHMIVLFLVF